MKKVEFLAILEETLEVDPGSIDESESLDDASWWDSMNALSFIALADRHLGVEVSGQDVAEARRLGDLLRKFDGHWE